MSGPPARTSPALAWLSRLPRALPVVVRSMGVGAAATLLDLGVLALLVSALGVSARLASAPALLLGVTAQFVGNKLFAFRDRSRDWVRQGLGFFAVEALGLLANLALFDLAVRHTAVPYLLARLGITSLVYFAVCLPLWSLVFRASATPALVPAPEGQS